MLGGSSSLQLANLCPTTVPSMLQGSTILYSGGQTSAQPASLKLYARPECQSAVESYDALVNLNDEVRFVLEALKLLGVVSIKTD